MKPDCNDVRSYVKIAAVMQMTNGICWREYAWFGAEEQKYETVQGCPPI
jgi:hypothetical protein